MQAQDVRAERRYRRIVGKYIGKFLLWGFTSSDVHGEEHFPTSGPFIVAGNHRGIMEVFLMVAICPRNIEILGAGDIPLDPRYRYFADFYGYIPYKRGQMDRAALTTAQHVLEEARGVGIFPEGGIWKSGRKTAHRGVAWLSFVAQAPVIPVGFGGVYRALERAVRLKKPYLETWVGAPIPTPPRRNDVPRRVQMEQHAERILDRIEELIPDWDRVAHVAPTWEQYHLEVWVSGSDADPRDRAGEIEEAELICRFFHLPVLVDVFYSNLKRKGVRPFRDFRRAHAVSDVHYAISVILGYVYRTNPAFLTYRFGDDTSQRLMRGLRSFRNLCQTIMDEQGNTARLQIVPVHRYRMTDTDPPVELKEPPPLRRF